jgi:hypothetical protein
MPRHYAVIDPASPRHPTWLRVLGTDAVEVRSAVPHVGEHLGQVGLYYLVSLSALAPEQLERVLLHLASAWDMAEETVASHLFGEHGLPLLADELRACDDPDDGRPWWRDQHQRDAEATKGGGV